MRNVWDTRRKVGIRVNYDIRFLKHQSAINLMQFTWRRWYVEGFHFHTRSILLMANWEVSCSIEKRRQFLASVSSTYYYGRIREDFLSNSKLYFFLVKKGTRHSSHSFHGVSNNHAYWFCQQFHDWCRYLLSVSPPSWSVITVVWWTRRK